MQLLICILLVLVLVLVSEVEAEVESVEQLVVEDYMGLWYEVYTYKESGSEGEGYCATEFYRERDEGVISVSE
jgi:lipocalin